MSFEVIKTTQVPQGFLMDFYRSYRYIVDIVDHVVF